MLATQDLQPSAGSQLAFEERSVEGAAEAEEVTPTVRLGSQLHVRLPRAQRVKAAVLVRRPVRHAIRRSHRHVRRAYAVHSSPPNAFGLPATQYR